MLTCIFEDENKAFLRHVVVDVLVLKGNKVLLVKRNGKLLEGGKWSLAGGFVERDETIAEAAKREVLEETGWEVGQLTLLTINDQPNRPKEDRQNVAFVMFGKAIKKIGKTDWESEDQQWFDLDALLAKNTIAFDHAQDIALYKKSMADKPIPNN